MRTAGGYQGPRRRTAGSRDRDTAVSAHESATAGVSDMYITGTMDPRWDNDILNPAFHALDADDFEVIELGWNPETSGVPER